VAEVRADCGNLPIDARLDFALKEGIALAFPRTTSVPRHPVADAIHRAACMIARRIEAHVPQQHQNVHGGVPTTVPRPAPPHRPSAP